MREHRHSRSFAELKGKGFGLFTGHLLAHTVEASILFFKLIVESENRPESRKHLPVGRRNHQRGDCPMVESDALGYRRNFPSAESDTRGNEYPFFESDVTKEAGAELSIEIMVNVIWIGDRSAIESIQPVMISSKICVYRSHFSFPISSLHFPVESLCNMMIFR
jgi:hypothetical protein